MKKIKDIMKNYTSIPNEVFGEPKIIIYPKEIRLENYGRITNITKDVIETNHFHFHGSNLIVKEMDNYCISISGKINTIEFKGDNHGK